jgi:hypothetical protein
VPDSVLLCARFAFDIKSAFGANMANASIIYGMGDWIDVGPNSL